MNLRTALLLAVLVLVAGILAATAVTVGSVLSAAARADVRADVMRGRAVFDELESYRQALHRSEGRVVADEPRLRAVVAAQDVNHQTVFGVALDLKKVLRSDLFLLTDAQGRLTADTADATAVGFELGEKPLIAGALKNADATGVWLSAGKPYEVHARRLDFGTAPIGVVVVGYTIDDRIAQSFYRQTATSMLIELGDEIVAASPLESNAPFDRPAFAAALRGLPLGGEDPTEITVGDTRYLALAVPLPGSTPTQNLRAVLVRSLDRALAPAKRLNQLLYLILAGGLLAAFVLAAVMSRSLARPLDQLVQFARQVGAGKTDVRAAVKGTVEVRALGTAMNQMVEEIAASRDLLAASERLEREMEIAQRIQVSILPKRTAIEGLEVAAAMLPASEVGGDYYDIIPVEGGAWIGIGDVAGHGLTAGLVMLMIQSAVSALTQDRAGAAPRDILIPLNVVLLDNIRTRLAQDEHVTLTLLRYFRDGRVVYAGAHEEMIVCRADTGKCELVPTPGTWLGAVRRIDPFTVDHTLTLRDGDLLVLYTDGVTEAWSASKEQFGLQRLCAEVERMRGESVETICENIMAAVAAWTDEQVDDVTLLVHRYRAA
jgi:phosphoserine phosphatase RsbU/P